MGDGCYIERKLAGMAWQGNKQNEAMESSPYLYILDNLETEEHMVF